MFIVPVASPVGFTDILCVPPNLVVAGGRTKSPVLALLTLEIEIPLSGSKTIIWLREMVLPVTLTVIG